MEQLSLSIGRRGEDETFEVSRELTVDSRNAAATPLLYRPSAAFAMMFR